MKKFCGIQQETVRYEMVKTWANYSGSTGHHVDAPSGDFSTGVIDGRTDGRARLRIESRGRIYTEHSPMRFEAFYDYTLRHKSNKTYRNSHWNESRK